MRSSRGPCRTTRLTRDFWLHVHSGWGVPFGCLTLLWHSDEHAEGAESSDALTFVSAPLLRAAPRTAPGVKLYHAARLGEEVQRAARPIVVSEYAVWREDPGAQDVSFRVRCSKGTYIRSLAHDLVRCTVASGLNLDRWCMRCFVGARRMATARNGDSPHRPVCTKLICVHIYSE